MIKNILKLSLISTALLSVTAFAVEAVTLPASAPAPASSTTPLLNQLQISNAEVPPPDKNLDAQAYVLMDANTGTIIAEKNMDVPRAPASLTKLMTLYVIQKALSQNRIKLDTPDHISKEAWQTGGSKAFVAYNSSPTVEQLMQGVIVDSGNDAAVALAQNEAGSLSSFVVQMNAEAQKLGMTNSHFATVDGLPDYKGKTITITDQHASAHDLAILARAIITEFPQYYHFYSEKNFTFNHITQGNRNTLLFTDPSVDGLKTGFTQEAGYCLIASGVKNNARLIAVAMGAVKEQDRDRDDESLLTYGFNFYQDLPIPSQTYEVVVIHGVHPKIKAGISSTGPNVVTLPKEITAAEITTTPVFNSEITAPVKAGDKVGTLNISYKGNIIESVPLVALEDNPTAGFLRHLFNITFGRL